MKKVYLRTMALACALGLTACGGGGDELTLTISPIYGLTKDGMTVRLNGGTKHAVAALATSFPFTNERVGTDSKFTIEIVDQPPNATCTMINGSGTTGAYAPTGIAISCIATPHNVKAKVTGLLGSLTVVNSATNYTITPADLTVDPVTHEKWYSFTRTVGTDTIGQVGDGNTYSFGILTQPNAQPAPIVQVAQTCELANGTGTMGDHDVTNVTITCL
ncbi:MAG: hypothetical protein V4484_01360 [Pseudomonadota bacterium]